MTTKKTSTKATTYEAMIAVARLSTDAPIETLIRRTFEAAYQAGLNEGYRQGRTDAAREAAGEPAPSEPRNIEIHS